MGCKRCSQDYLHEKKERRDIRETAKALADMEKPKKKRGGKRKPLPVDEILKMKKAGCTVQQIADRFGCARSHVYAELKKVPQ